MRRILLLLCLVLFALPAPGRAEGGKLLIALASFRERPRHPKIYFYEHDGLANGKIVGLIGEPPKRFSVSEWESLDAAQAYYKSPARQALNDLRAKAQKVVRQFIVEAPANYRRSCQKHRNTQRK